MLSKSLKSSFIMGFIFVLTAITLTMILYRGDEMISVHNLVTLTALAVAWLLMNALIGAVLSLPIYIAFDDSYFGYQGAIRWFASGVLVAFWVRVGSLLLPGSTELSSCLRILFIALGPFMFRPAYRLLSKFSFRQSRQ